MSLLGKKRTKRENDDEKVRHNHLILINLLFKKEYNQMFGIKEEGDQNDNTNKDSGENTNIQKDENKIENKEIKIIEMTFILPSKEKILQKNIRKVVKIEKEKEEEKDKSTITTAPMETKKLENKTKIEIKEEKEIKKDNKKEEKNESVKIELNNENNIFKTKPADNPFNALIDNNNNLEEKKDINKSEKPTFNLFSNINNKNENNNDNAKQSLFIKTDIKVESKDNGGSLFSNTKSLFSGNNIGNSLFSGNNNGNTLFSGGNTKSLFSGNDGKPLFSDSNTLNNNNNKGLFSGTSLFSNNNGNSLFSPNLFSNNNIKANPFTEIKGEAFVQSLFNNSNKSNENNNTNNNKGLLFDYNQGGEDNEEEDERDKPKTVYASEPLKAQDYSDYSKLYNTHLYNLFLYRKSEKKFISKGSGFLSIEKSKDEKSEQHKAVIVFRNQTGNKLVEGFLDKNLNKFDIYNKDFNYVVCFGIIMMNDGKAEFGYIKIPFKSEENANALKDAFEKAISSINGKDTK